MKLNKAQKRILTIHSPAVLLNVLLLSGLLGVIITQALISRGM